MRAIRVSEFGGPERLVMEDVPDAIPGPEEALIRVLAAGVNYIDTYHRTGLYPMPLPFTPGVEAVGEVIGLGEGVDGVAVGQRVAYASVLGSYAELVAAPLDKLITVPEDIESAEAAAVMLQGLTAHYLSHDTYPLGPSSRCLIHAGAGGVGLLLIQMAKMRGATVFTTVSTAEKAALAEGAGADHVIRYTEIDFVEAVQAELGFHKLDVVYDGVGQATFDGGLQLLRRRGVMVLFGQSSGPVEPFDLQRLSGGGSLFVTRPTLGDYVTARQQLVRRTDDLFGWMASGELDVRVGQTFALTEASAAHAALQGRLTTGKLLLHP